MVSNPFSSSRTPVGNPLALRPVEAARMLGIGQTLLAKLTKAGAIPHIKLGRCVLYPRPMLEAWLVQQASKSGGNQ